MRNCYFNSTSLPSSCCPGGQPQYAHLTAPISLMKLQSGQFLQAPRRLPRQSTSILVSFGAEKKSDTRWNILVDWLILYASHHLFVDFKNHCPIEKRFIKFDWFGFHKKTTESPPVPVSVNQNTFSVGNAEGRN